MGSSTLPHVRATINFAAPHDPRPEIHAHPPPEGQAARSAKPVRIEVPVHDVRSRREALCLDAEGLEIVPLSSAIDAKEASARGTALYAEAEASVAAATGARRVVAFDHNVRSAPRSEAGEPGFQRPVRFAHNDYTESSGPQRVRDLLPDDAEALLQRRFAVINLWRPLGHPAEDVPLGVCDARSIRPEQLQPTALKYSDRTGEIYSLVHDSAQRWLYVPALPPDEALLLKCYDSATDGRARFTAHAAFRDPAARPEAPPRESLEVRTLVFF